MKKIKILLSFCILSLVSCSKDNSSNSSSWYTNMDLDSFHSILDDVNDAIDNEELLYTFASLRGNDKEYYATKDLFFYNSYNNKGTGGCLWDCEHAHGRFRFNINAGGNGIVHIIDSKTLEIYYTTWYAQGTADYGETVVFQLDSNGALGVLDCAATPTTYTYANDDGTLYVSNGDIYTLIDGSLYKNGDSKPYKPFNPTKVK